MSQFINMSQLIIISQHIHMSKNIYISHHIKLPLIVSNVTNIFMLKLYIPVCSGLPHLIPLTPNPTSSSETYRGPDNFPPTHPLCRAKGRTRVHIIGFQAGRPHLLVDRNDPAGQHQRELVPGQEQDDERPQLLADRGAQQQVPGVQGREPDATGTGRGRRVDAQCVV